MTKTPAAPPASRGSRLQREAAGRIRELLVRRESPAGTHLPEIELSRELGISRMTMYRLMEKHGLQRDDLDERDPPALRYRVIHIQQKYCQS